MAFGGFNVTVKFSASHPNPDFTASRTLLRSRLFPFFCCRSAASQITSPVMPAVVMLPVAAFRFRPVYDQPRARTGMPRAPVRFLRRPISW